MNTKHLTRTAGAGMLLALMFSAAACGTDTASTTGIGQQPKAPAQARIYPPSNLPVVTPAPHVSPAPTSADAAERRGVEAARAERRARQHETKLGHATLP